MAPQHLHGQGLEHVISCFSESASEREMGISVIYFNNFQYSKAVEQRRVDLVVRTGPKSVLALSRMSSETFLFCRKARLGISWTPGF